MKHSRRIAFAIGAVVAISVELTLWVSTLVARQSTGSIFGFWTATIAVATALAVAITFLRITRAYTKQLSASLDREREFASHLAHELRTPLTVLKTELQVEQRGEPTESQRSKTLGDMIATVNEITNLVDNLMMLARLERDADPSRLAAIEVHAMADEMWRRVAARAERRGLTFTNELPVGFQVVADVTKLRLVVSNLLSNAASYTETGGSVIVRLTNGAGFEVWDSGPPLDNHSLEHVFDRLWRADTARTDATKHAGLGLSLARAMCRHMRFDLIARNTEDGGLAFVIVTRPSG